MEALTLQDFVSILNSKQTSIKHQLAMIGTLDQEVDEKMRKHEILAQSFIQSMENSTVKYQPNDTVMTKKIEDLRNLERQIQMLTKQKIRISNSIYCNISGSCEYFDEVVGEQRLESVLKINDPKFTKSYLLTEDVETMFRDEQKIEFQCYCVCGGKGNGGTMIQCEGKECSKRWFHLRCLNIQNSKIPKGEWWCSECKAKDKRTFD